MVKAAASGPPSINGDTFAWNGASGASWGTAANWRDISAGLSSASYVPGTLTPVVLAGPANAPSQVITGGGTAASVGLTGAIELVGRYAMGSALTIGTLAVGAGAVTTLTPSALTLLSGGTIVAGSASVIGGMLSLAVGTTLTASGSVAVGTVGGQDVPNNGTYVYTGGAAGMVSLAPGATLSVGGGLLLNQGTLADAGGVVSVGGGLTVGAAMNGTPGSGYYTLAGAGGVAVTGGGVLTVAGGIAAPDGVVVADGIGSSIVAGSMFTASAGRVYTSVSNLTVASVFSSLAALNGGFVRVGGAVLNATSGAAVGLLVDGSSTIEVGSAGGAAQGAITVDANNSVTISGGGTVTGSLIDNGTVLLSGGTVVQNGNVSGSGVVRVGANTTWVLNGNVAASDTISFLGAGAVLTIGGTSAIAGLTPTPYAVGAAIGNFGGNDMIDVTDLSFGSLAAPSVVAAGGTSALRITDGIHNATVTLLGSFSVGNFSFGSDGAGGTQIGYLGP